MQNKKKVTYVTNVTIKSKRWKCGRIYVVFAEFEYRIYCNLCIWTTTTIACICVWLICTIERTHSLADRLWVRINVAFPNHITRCWSTSCRLSQIIIKCANQIEVMLSCVDWMVGFSPLISAHIYLNMCKIWSDRR